VFSAIASSAAICSFGRPGQRDQAAILRFYASELVGTTLSCDVPANGDDNLGDIDSGAPFRASGFADDAPPDRLRNFHAL
jgi:hypothetical protein